MSDKFQTNREQRYDCMSAVDEFFATFRRREAHKLLHKMIRAALAQKEILNKDDIRDLLYMKEHFTDLIQAAEILSGYKNTPPVFKKLFEKRPADEWIESLDDLFHHAVYDGLFTSQPADDDIYGIWRGLFKIINACWGIHTPEFRPKNEEEIAEITN